MVTPSIVALIPARGGSQRLPRKNIRLLNGHPTMAYTIAAAKGAGIFTEVIVATDDDTTADLAQDYGASVFRRTEARWDEPDCAWMRLMLQRTEDAYAILRPTSPFRTADTISRAWYEFQRQQPCDSVRAVEVAKQHPGKMWVLREQLRQDGTSANPAIGSVIWRRRLLPLLPFEQQIGELTVPWHSSPTQTLGTVFVQNASLEIGWTYNIKQPAPAVAGTYAQQGSIAGEVVAPFFPVYPEGFDLNTEEDWAKAQTLLDWLPDLATGQRIIRPEALSPPLPEGAPYGTTKAKDPLTDPYGKPAGWHAPEYSC